MANTLGTNRLSDFDTLLRDLKEATDSGAWQTATQALDELLEENVADEAAPRIQEQKTKGKNYRSHPTPRKLHTNTNNLSGLHL